MERFLVRILGYILQSLTPFCCRFQPLIHEPKEDGTPTNNMDVDDTVETTTMMELHMITMFVAFVQIRSEQWSLRSVWRPSKSEIQSGFGNYVF